MKRKSYEKWEDVPPEKRVDVEFLYTRRGAKEPKWLERQLSRLKEEASCQKVIRWISGEDRWQRCRLATTKGERFCPKHGGMRVNATDAAIRKLDRRKAALEVRKGEIDQELAEILEAKNRLRQS